MFLFFLVSKKNLFHNNSSLDAVDLHDVSLECQCASYRTFISLLETLIDRGRDKLLEIILGYDFIDMLIFDTFLSIFCKQIFFLSTVQKGNQ